MNSNGTMTEMQQYAAGQTVYCDPPTEAQMCSGVIPLDTLPASWWNWLWKTITGNNNAAICDLANLREEMLNVLSTASVCPSCVCTNQLATAIQCIAQKIGTDSIAGAVKSCSSYKSVSIDQLTGTMLVNALSDWNQNNTVQGVMSACEAVQAACNTTYAQGISANASSIASLNTVVSSKPNLGTTSCGIGASSGTTYGTSAAGVATTAAASDHTHAIVIAKASTTQAGVVQLNNTISCNSTTLAATAASVCLAYECAVAAASALAIPSRLCVTNTSCNTTYYFPLVEDSVLGGPRCIYLACGPTYNACTGLFKASTLCATYAIHSTCSIDAGSSLSAGGNLYVCGYAKVRIIQFGRCSDGAYLGELCACSSDCCLYYNGTKLGGTPSSWQDKAHPVSGIVVYNANCGLMYDSSCCIGLDTDNGVLYASELNAPYIATQYLYIDGGVNIVMSGRQKTRIGQCGYIADGPGYFSYVRSGVAQSVVYNELVSSIYSCLAMKGLKTGKYYSAMGSYNNQMIKGFCFSTNSVVLYTWSNSTSPIACQYSFSCSGTEAICDLYLVAPGNQQ